MPRRTRLHVPGGFYHVTLRGNHREALFGDEADFRKLDEIVAKALAAYEARLHAFCWMPNHLHALVQIADHPLGDLVKSIAATYARYRHKVLDTSGHLFERRHHARLVDVNAYFLAVLRYIHLNPVKACLVPDPRDYRWSSHRAYLGTETINWLTVGKGLSMFGPGLVSARRGYARFMGQMEDDADDIDENAHPEDSRVLGDDAFLEQLRNEPSACSEPTAAVGALTLDALAASVCTTHGVRVELLRSPSTMRSLTPVRLELLLQALEMRVATTAEVARYLGRAPSTLSKLLSRRRRNAN